MNIVVQYSRFRFRFNHQHFHWQIKTNQLILDSIFFLKNKWSSLAYFLHQNRSQRWIAKHQQANGRQFQRRRRFVLVVTNGQCQVDGRSRFKRRCQLQHARFHCSVGHDTLQSLMQTNTACKRASEMMCACHKPAVKTGFTLVEVACAANEDRTRATVCSCGITSVSRPWRCAM